MTPDQFRDIPREELKPLEKRVGRFEDRRGGLETRLTGAILILADHTPGSLPRPAVLRHDQD